MIRHLVTIAALVAVLVLLPNPPRQPMKQCTQCKGMNEPDRSACISCGASL